jgi:hypothetical protein
MQRAEVESTVEAVGQRRQVSSGVVSEVDCMIAIGQASVEIAQDGVDPPELWPVFRFSSGDDGRLMYAPGFGDDPEPGQTIRKRGAAL